ncbi:MAG: adenylate kinase [Spirochaetes bacterium]|nr:adenylate kinase [Spirochaetota bacterium]
MKMVFLGPPGAGKGTLSSLASMRLGLPHISTGDLFREAVRRETRLGEKVKGIIAEGRLVPDDLTIALVRERLAQPDTASGWILDGFPRTIPQAEALQAVKPVDLVVDFDVGDEMILFRLTGRRVCGSCGKIYHVATMPPKTEGICDVCGKPLVIRPDDREAAIRTRLAAYREQTQPLVAWYGKRGLIASIDGSGSPETVYRLFSEALTRRVG